MLVFHDLSSTGCQWSHEHTHAWAAAEWHDKADLGNEEHPQSLAIFFPTVTFRIIRVVLQLANNARGAEDTDCCEDNSGNVNGSRAIEAADGGSEQSKLEEA